MIPDHSFTTPRGIPDQSFVAWKAIITVLYGIAIFTTLIGLLRRYRAKEWRRDDYIAIVPALLAIVAMVVMWELYGEHDSHARIPRQRALYWSMSVSWVTMIWLTRIGLALSLGRMMTADTTPKRFAFGLALSFLILYIGNIAWLFTTGCKHHGRLRWSVRTTAYCNAYKQGFWILTFVANFISELLLVSGSVVIYTKASLSPHRRNALLTTGAAVAMTLATIAHAAFYFSPLVRGAGGLLVIDMMTQFEAIISIAACSFTSLMTGGRIAYPRRGNASLVKASKPLAVNVITLTELDRSSKYAFSNDDASDLDGDYALKKQPIA